MIRTSRRIRFSCGFSDLSGEERSFGFRQVDHVLSCVTDVCVGDLGSAAAAETGRGVLLLCCSDYEGEDPDLIL